MRQFTVKNKNLVDSVKFVTGTVTDIDTTTWDYVVEVDANHDISFSSYGGNAISFISASDCEIVFELDDESELGRSGTASGTTIEQEDMENIERINYTIVNTSPDKVLSVTINSKTFTAKNTLDILPMSAFERTDIVKFFSLKNKDGSGDATYQILF